jgi:hypothetical protein
MAKQNVMVWPRSYKLRDGALSIAAEISKLLDWESGDDLELTLDMSDPDAKRLTVRKVEAK